MNNPMIPQERRYDLDWLRILAFAGLILFHTGMLYAESWGFHFKSHYLSSELESLMLIFSPWRMLLIWFVSGAASYFLFEKAKGWRQRGALSVNRSISLLLPLLTGLWLIVPVQLYAQMSQEAGLQMGYGEFFLAFLDLQHPLFSDYQSGVWPHVDVNHLWYLRSLWVYSLILILVAPLLTKWRMGAVLAGGFSRAFWPMVLLVVVLMAGIRGHFSGDSIRELQGGVWFLFGFLLAGQVAFRDALVHKGPLLGGLFTLNLLLILAGYNGWLAADDADYMGVIRLAVYSLQQVLGVLLMLALAARWLNFDHPWRRPLNNAVYPSYLVHQSLIIGLAFVAAEQGMSLEAELLLVIGGTLAGCVLVCWLGMKISWLKPFIGMKWQENSGRQVTLPALLATLLILPLAWEILV